MMRRIGKFGLLITLAAWVMCAAAFADVKNLSTESSAQSKGFSITVEGTPTADGVYEGVEKITVTYDKSVSGKQYLIVALTEKPAANAAPAEDKIVYIDQQAGNGGKLTFTVYPSELNDQPYYLYMYSDDESANSVFIGTYMGNKTFIRGDVNGDGEVDVFDALAIIDHTLGITLKDEQFSAANVDDSSSEIDIFDALKIIDYCLGNISKSDL